MVTAAADFGLAQRHVHNRLEEELVPTQDDVMPAVIHGHKSDLPVTEGQLQHCLTVAAVCQRCLEDIAALPGRGAC